VNAEIARHVNTMPDSAGNSGPSSVEFEVAYQARVVMDRIRFAIRVTDQSSPNSAQLREAGVQLLDAFDRLDQIDRRFQTRLKPRERCLNGSVAIGGKSK
jgi:hypothetical protein